MLFRGSLNVIDTLFPAVWFYLIMRGLVSLKSFRPPRRNTNCPILWVTDVAGTDPKCVWLIVVSAPGSSCFLILFFTSFYCDQGNLSRLRFSYEEPLKLLWILFITIFAIQVGGSAKPYACLLTPMKTCRTVPRNRNRLRTEIFFPNTRRMRFGVHLKGCQYILCGLSSNYAIFFLFCFALRRACPSRRLLSYNDEENERETLGPIIRSHDDSLLTHPLPYLLLDRTMAIDAECTLLHRLPLPRWRGCTYISIFQQTSVYLYLSWRSLMILGLSCITGKS